MNKLPERSEHAQQCAIFEFAKLMSREYPKLKMLVGSASGVRIGIGQAMKLKRAGCLPSGYPDIHLPVKNRLYNGLFIELKKTDGKLSNDQKWWLEKLTEQNYYAVPAYGEDEAKEILMIYITGKVYNAN